VASFHTRVSRIIVEDGKRMLSSGETVTVEPGRHWFLSPPFHPKGEW